MACLTTLLNRIPVLLLILFRWILHWWGDCPAVCCCGCLILDGQGTVPSLSFSLFVCPQLTLHGAMVKLPTVIGGISPAFAVGNVAGPYGAGLMWEATGHYRSAFVTFGCFGILAFGVNLYTIKFAAEQLAVAAAVAVEGKQDRQGGTAVGEEASQATSI